MTDRPLRVAHVGAVAGVGERLVEGLVAAGHDAVFVDLVEPGAEQLSAIRKALALPRRARQMLAARRRLRSGGFDVVHVHYATRAIWFLGVAPVVVMHAHGSDVRDQPGPRRPPLRWLARRVSMVLVSTPDLLAHIDGVYLPNPVEVDRPSAPPDTPSVFVFSAFLEVKGAPRLVEAIRLLRQRRPDVPVRAIRQGPYAGEAAVAGAELIDPVPAGEIPSLIAAHQVVVGQQLLGVLGVSELQAMALARPVAVDLHLGDTYVDPPPVLDTRSAVEIADAVERLLDDADLRSDLGRRGRNWVATHHATPIVVDRLVALYRGALGSQLSRA
jgi:glycosyltransferase involved in cell wall biosynthesis